MDETRSRAIAWSRQLADVHMTLLDRVQELRDGSAGSADLLTHCLSFCSALTTHHEGEDGGLFAELVRARPDLAATVAALREDHQLIGNIVEAVRDLAAESPRATPERQAAIRAELDGLAAIMESHFRYEERAIGTALDGGIEDTGWTRPVFSPRT
ncbi:hemerythrin domain-containing protein [Jiangella sp. DSM 45060]|uniref:hemerythrin domain-containing protein n=1 Tax=Jiangella sp. DSM 45060 TaxID=1798224 RepID=UPI00087AD737|nr:hemerythrin domain-containing protein [Jiangella sp. DSM 45060]SDT61130.1 Hemerythrin HHE cation binding domain-containing protein [Jiangella sp. DSM 45060]